MRFSSSVSICHVHNIISIINVNDAMGKLTITRQAYFIFYHMLPLVRVSNVTLLNLISSSTGRELPHLFAKLTTIVDA